MRNDLESQDGPGNGSLPVLRLQHDFDFILCLSSFLVRSESRRVFLFHFRGKKSTVLDAKWLSASRIPRTALLAKPQDPYLVVCWDVFLPGL